jgi:hypothetical protein
MHEHPKEFFVRLESRVWDALARGDADADQELLASDFIGVYATGFADRSNHAAQLADGPTVGSYSINDARLLRLSASAVVLCYRAEYQRLRGGVLGRNETMYISSLWTERDGRWWNLFSQDTPASSVPHASEPRL